MDIGELLTRDSILLSIRAANYDVALERLSIHFSHITSLRQQQVLDALREREARGTTALGNGVALPHARCEGLYQPHGVFIRFEEPVEADAPDGEPVTIAFAMLAPENADASYLRAVGRVAAILKSPSKRTILEEGDKDEIYAVLTGSDA